MTDGNFFKKFAAFFILTEYRSCSMRYLVHYSIFGVDFCCILGIKRMKKENEACYNTVCISVDKQVSMRNSAYERRKQK